MLDQVNRLQNENNELKSELAALRAGVPAGAVRGPGVAVTAPAYAPPVVPVAGGADDEAPADAVVPVPTESPAPAPVRPAPPASHATPAAFAQASASQAGRTHAVAKGDTLYSLAQRYYGSRSKWRDIFAANRDRLASPGTPLRIGLTLRIP